MAEWRETARWYGGDGERVDSTPAEGDARSELDFLVERTSAREGQRVDGEWTIGGRVCARMGGACLVRVCVCVRPVVGVGVMSCASQERELRARGGIWLVGKQKEREKENRIHRLEHWQAFLIQTEDWNIACPHSLQYFWCFLFSD